MGENEAQEEQGKVHESKEGKSEKPSIASRGVPSSESLYFPPHNSEELRSFQDKDENITRNLWNREEVANFVFSKKYQAKYYEITSAFLKLLSEKLSLSGEDLSAFINANGISKATFYNRVLPRLRRVGMIKIERDTIVAMESKRKFRPMRISLSKTFGNYLMKIGDSWLGVVDDARSRKKE
ncbi:MAG: hypothetical protein PHI06_14315 [Desulfobulbaceae bacterium]|nr:hypothetical protein [Desulfobulbaceae bacterium]